MEKKSKAYYIKEAKKWLKEAEHMKEQERSIVYTRFENLAGYFANAAEDFEKANMKGEARECYEKAAKDAEKKGFYVDAIEYLKKAGHDKDAAELKRDIKKGKLKPNYHSMPH